MAVSLPKRAGAYGHQHVKTVKHKVKGLLYFKMYIKLVLEQLSCSASVRQPRLLLMGRIEYSGRCVCVT